MHREAENLLSSFQLNAEELETYENAIVKEIDPIKLAAAVWAVSKNRGFSIADILDKLSVKNPDVRFVYEYASNWETYLSYDSHISPVDFVPEFHNKLIELISDKSVRFNNFERHIISLVVKARINNGSVTRCKPKEIWNHKYNYKLLYYLKTSKSLTFLDKFAFVLPIWRIHIALIRIHWILSLS